MRADARGRRAEDSHVQGKRLRRDGRVDGRLPAAVPRRVRERPRGFVPARMLTRGDTLVEPVASPRPPGSADSRSRKNDRRDAERLARLALAGEVSPVWVPPEQVEGLRELAQATGDLACVREAARQRAGATLCRHGMSWDERTPTGRLKKRWGQHFWNWLRSIDLGDAGSQAAYLAALSAAESAEGACDGPGAKAEGVARASDPGPPVDTPVRARGRVPPRPHALGGPGRRGPGARPRPGERTGARVRASRRGCLGPRAGQPGVPQEGRDAGAPRDPRARAGLLGRAPRTSQGAGLPRPGAPRGQHRHGRRDGAHAAPRRQGRAGGRRAGRSEVRAARAAVSADMGLRAGTSVSQRSSGTQVRICHRRLTKNFREDGHCLLTVFGSYEGHC